MQDKQKGLPTYEDEAGNIWKILVDPDGNYVVKCPDGDIEHILGDDAKKSISDLPPSIGDSINEWLGERRREREDEQYYRDVEDTDRRAREAHLRESCGMPPGCDTYRPRYISRSRYY